MKERPGLPVLVAVVFALVGLAIGGAARRRAGVETAPASVAPGDLRDPSAFAAIPDRQARSRALFAEASKVFQHARCVNCHPSDDTPRQGDEGRLHEPPVARGPDGRGVPAMRCQGCHQDHNLEDARVPGAPDWHLAPPAMVWLGRTPREICVQVKDRSQNGGRSLEELHRHVAHDPLVGWAWHPGHARSPAPGTQARLGALVRAWIDTGAECPEEDRR